MARNNGEFLMDPITIGLWTTGGMLVFVFLGMRVAFAAGLAGFVGLVWLRWALLAPGSPAPEAD